MKFKDILLPRIVFEIKYKQGYRYLDRCGETMIEIENKLENWVAKEVSPSSGQMQNSTEKMVFNFSSLKLDLSQYDLKESNTDKFIADLKTITNIVTTNLGIKDCLRFGFRFWFLYPLNSAEEGRKILSKSKIFNVNDTVEKLFGKKIKDSSIVIVLEDKKDKESFGHRIALSIVYREGTLYESDGKSKLLSTPPHALPKGQREALRAQLEMKAKEAKEPSVGILVDIDNYMINPKKEYLNHFIEESSKLSKNNIINIVEG